MRTLLSWILILSTLPGGELCAAELDDLLSEISPDVKKWASVVEVRGEETGMETEDGDGEDPRELSFHWSHYGKSADAVDFWPASAIKIYTVVAALEHLNELKMPMDCVVSFERKHEGRWKLDAARTMREMISEVFRRSSNEDYTLLLRMPGIDRINTRFLIPENGFPHSALMRDYITYRPLVYENEEPQRVFIRSQDGKSATVEHTWSGVSYAEQRGATALSSTTGNCTSTRELADCLRRIMFHEHLPESERHNLTADQLRFIREGGDGLVGLENKAAGPFAWTEAAEIVFPNCRFYHKGGYISSYALDVAYIDDPDSGKRFILAVAAKSGETKVVKSMARAICEWMRDKDRREEDSSEW